MPHLELNSQSNHVHMDIKVSNKIEIFMDQPNAPCKSYTDGPNGFNLCWSNYISSQLSNGSICTIPGRIFKLFSFYKKIRWSNFLFNIIAYINFKIAISKKGGFDACFSWLKYFTLNVVLNKVRRSKYYQGKNLFIHQISDRCLVMTFMNPACSHQTFNISLA